MIPFRTPAAATLFFSFVLATVGYGHPVPDGVIHRGVQVVVHDDKIEIRYQIGLNDKMVQTELERLEAEEVPSDSSAALSDYRDSIRRQLPKNLEIRIGNEAVEVDFVRADIVRQHHASVECVYEIPIAPTTKPQKLEISDQNFPKVDGMHLIALRGRGKIEVLQTNAALSLLRIASSVEEEKPEEYPVQRRLETYFCLPAN